MLVHPRRTWYQGYVYLSLITFFIAIQDTRNYLKWRARLSFFTLLIIYQGNKAEMQPARVSQKTAFFHLGNMVEYGETGQIFTTPQDPRTESYITGRIG